jgi:hypothetical protein
VWVGSDGTLVADAYGERLVHLDPARHKELTASPPPPKYPRVASVYAEWIAACKGGPAAGSNFAEHAGPLTQMVLLGNFAVRAAKPIDVDPATGNLKTTGIPEHYWKPEYRKGWTL